MGNNHVFNTGHKVCCYLTCAAVQKLEFRSRISERRKQKRVYYLREAMEVKVSYIYSAGGGGGKESFRNAHI